MDQYHFYGWEQADVPARETSYPGIRTPLDLYDKLSQVWCRETCAPRLQAVWTPENKTLVSAPSRRSWRRISSAGKCMAFSAPAGTTTATTWWMAMCLT